MPHTSGELQILVQFFAIEIKRCYKFCRFLSISVPSFGFWEKIDTLTRSYWKSRFYCKERADSSLRNYAHLPTGKVNVSCFKNRAHSHFKEAQSYQILKFLESSQKIFLRAKSHKELFFSLRMLYPHNLPMAFKFSNPGAYITYLMLFYLPCRNPLLCCLLHGSRNQ